MPPPVLVSVVFAVVSAVPALAVTPSVPEDTVMPAPSFTRVAPVTLKAPAAVVANEPPLDVSTSATIDVTLKAPPEDTAPASSTWFAPVTVMPPLRVVILPFTITVLCVAFKSRFPLFILSVPPISTFCA